ncbi:polymorphic toxin type 15 domain-containing protein [Listeria booriae]|uniref:polymorphic toxin type 15 domain-containing protein n=1 Tax=Listeria booriae TaxID=1552123 RepID=UPI002892EBD0|nr:polymorphic toxin type 15 domain-containing protein [Listeria booriae]
MKISDTALTFIPFEKLGKVAKAIKTSTRTDEFKFLYEGVGEIKQADNASKSKKFAKFIKLDKIEVTFIRNPKHDPEEFARQLADQEKGMNELTVSEYLANREKYLAQGRALEGNVMQQATREESFTQKVNELRKSDISLTEARKQAKNWMDTQAALHNPDQIAGGNPLNIGGLGDKRINSSIASQWKYRIDIVDEQINQMISQIPKAQWKDIYLNVSLKHWEANHERIRRF